MANIFPENSLNPLYRMHECGAGNYWYYYKGSFPSECPLYYQHLIKNANSSIEIFDPHFNVNIRDNDTDIFRDINTGVTIKILTMKGLDGAGTYLTNIENQMKANIPSSKNIRFGLRVVNKSEPLNYGEKYFHDRFLIIDQTEVYLVGSSIGWHLKSFESTGIYKITDPNTKAFIISIFNVYWNSSANHQIPVRYLHPAV